MKYLTMQIVFALCIIFSFGCKKNKKESKTTADNNKEITQNNLTFKDSNIAAVYTDYIKIKQALVQSNAKETATAAKKMVTSLHKINGNETAKKALQTIVNTTDLKAQRVAFSTLSNSIETIVTGNVTSGIIYKDFCPMALKKGAYWLSSQKEIRNPYYGDKMLKCGVVKKTIQ